jgi:hypothetical protein
MDQLYDQDFIGWTEQQARLLREAAGRGTNLSLDWSNLVEEVEGLGRSHYDAVASQIRRIIVHLLKLEFSPAGDPRPGWVATIADARAEVESRLAHDPGLRPRVRLMLHEEAPRAVKAAAQQLRAYGEDAAAREVGRLGDHYTAEQVLGDWLPGTNESP